MPDGADTSAAPQEHAAAIEHLNRTCFCLTLDRDALHAALAAQSGEAGLPEMLPASHPHLFAHTPVFLSQRDDEAMRAIVAGVEAAARLHGFRDAVSSWAPDAARADFGPRGAFMGYDFHLGPDGPKLIEVNTNAGGAFLNAVLARAQVACCAEIERGLASSTLDAFEESVTAMFEAEWRLQRGARNLRSIAIVDDAPEEQYLHPEFLLAQHMLRRRGYDAIIADARSLRYQHGVLMADGRAIDLVYNRLVDFALAAPEHAALRAAYLDGAVVLAPNPHNHALFADKRNLTLLSDQAALRAWGLDEKHLRALQGIPRAVRVNRANAESMWSERKKFFFKPASGHGGKAVYRGDKLTRSVWDAILTGDYVAQEVAPPSERTILLGDEPAQRKLDVRLYVYDGRVLLAGARLYQGQTTNFRTPGGGFAPVFFI